MFMNLCICSEVFVYFINSIILNISFIPFIKLRFGHRVRLNMIKRVCIYIITIICNDVTIICNDIIWVSIVVFAFNIPAFLLKGGDIAVLNKTIRRLNINI